MYNCYTEAFFFWKTYIQFVFTFVTLYHPLNSLKSDNKNQEECTENEDFCLVLRNLQETEGSRYTIDDIFSLSKIYKRREKHFLFHSSNDGIFTRKIIGLIWFLCLMAYQPLEVI